MDNQAYDHDMKAINNNDKKKGEEVSNSLSYMN